jgi:hypothetical protein
MKLSKAEKKEQCRDTGMAMVLLFLILYLFFRQEIYLYAAVGIHVVNMVVPAVFLPVAVLWMGLSNAMGWIVSRVLLSVIFLVVVTPVGMVRRWFGKDALRLGEYREGRGSVMQKRNHTYTAEDIRKPY